MSNANGETVDTQDPYWHEREAVLAGEGSVEYLRTVQVALGATPRTWPQLFSAAVESVYPNGEVTDAEYLMRFEERHGACSTEHMAALARAYLAWRNDPLGVDSIHDLDGDQVFILLMLGVWPEHPGAQLACDVLEPFLASSDSLERMVSAISLSHLRDEQAISALLTALTEGLPTPEPWDVETDEQAREYWQEFETAAFHMHMPYRLMIPAILSRWGVRSAIPALRQALGQTARIERTEAHWDTGRPRRWQQDWQVYQYELLKALGQFGAFGALVGIDLLEDTVSRNTRLGYWRVQMCLAAVRRRLEAVGQYDPTNLTEIWHEVEQLLVEQFGLDEEELRAIMTGYTDHQLRLDLG